MMEISITNLQPGARTIYPPHGSWTLCPAATSCLLIRRTIELMYLVLSVLAVLIVLLVSEYGWRRRWFNNEFGRKFVHITVGSFVAFWPFFLSWNEIRLLSVAFLVAVAISSKLKIFSAIHSVQRPTFGEMCFAVTVGLLTYVTHSRGIYAVALLQMSLADGFAAVFGNLYGKGNTYHLFGHSKSVVGSAAFVVTSAAILVGYNLLGGGHLRVADVATGAVVGSFFENIAPFGLDNIVVPLFIGWLLTNL